ncbi:MAG: hypothetical protein ABIQ93_01185 [Saprospiraceae bacterium]
MNVKRIFGMLLTLLGIGGLIYAAFIFMNTSGGTYNMKALTTACILGAVFFIAGIGLVKATKDTDAPSPQG